MTRRSRFRLPILLLLLGLTLAWPVLGSASQLTGADGCATAHGSAPAVGSGHAGCDGCAGSGGPCPASVCAVAAAIAPAQPPLPSRPAGLGTAEQPDDRGRGRVPDVQTPPPRWILLTA